jgi:acyl-CoA-binding protein|tara:strand:+ start:245 stop:478 length:234 start_codon:yes stop_codon:yes gene_type:complete
MTEKERTHFFFFFARLRACISDDALFEAKRAIFEGKKRAEFWDGFRGKSRENAHGFYIAKDDEHETIAEISHREKRR